MITWSKKLEGVNGAADGRTKLVVSIIVSAYRYLLSRSTWYQIRWDNHSTLLSVPGTGRQGRSITLMEHGLVPGTTGEIWSQHKMCNPITPTAYHSGVHAYRYSYCMFIKCHASYMHTVPVLQLSKCRTGAHTVLVLPVPGNRYCL